MKTNNILVVPLNNQKRSVEVSTYRRGVEKHCKWFLTIPNGIYVIKYRQLDMNDSIDCELAKENDFSKAHNSYIFCNLKVLFSRKQNCSGEKEKLLNDVYYPAMIGNIESSGTVCTGTSMLRTTNRHGYESYLLKNHQKLEDLAKDVVANYWSSNFNDSIQMFELQPEFENFGLQKYAYFRKWQSMKDRREISDYIWEYPHFSNRPKMSHFRSQGWFLDDLLEDFYLSENSTSTILEI